MCARLAQMVFTARCVAQDERVGRAWRAGSPGNAIFAAGCLLDFFWNDIGSQSARGQEILRLLRPLFGLRGRGRDGSPDRQRLVVRAVTAWQSHLRNAPL